jgi:hypothetical protein
VAAQFRGRVGWLNEIARCVPADVSLQIRVKIFSVNVLDFELFNTTSCARQTTQNVPYYTCMSSGAQRGEVRADLYRFIR